MGITKKKLLFMSIVVLTMILVSNIFGYVNENYSSQSGTTTEKVNFRKNTKLEYDSIAKTLDNNTKIQILGKMDNFYISILESGNVGLISKDYSKLIATKNTNFPEYTNLENYYATVLYDYTNLRGGPSTDYSVYKKLNKGEEVQVIGKIKDFFLVSTKDNYIGMLKNNLIAKKEEKATLPNTPETLFNLINDKRLENGKEKLELDENLSKIAKEKAIDMVNSNYFSHTSKTYGTIFSMLQSSGIKYKVAGENISGNESVEDALLSWLASDEHKQNILSNTYNHIGIAVEKSKIYGNVIVVVFTGS